VKNEAVAALLGESYVWIDHSQGVVAETVEDLLRVLRNTEAGPPASSGSSG